MTSAAPNLDHVLDVALAIAHRAGDILMDKFLRLEQISKKGIVDLVTEADLASEREIVMSIRNAFPNHAFIAEEGDYDQAQPSPYRWVIDPLDGTTNYVHGLPIFAVSIGYQQDGDTKVGIVLNPAQDEEYVAVQGRGATLNGTTIHVSSVSILQESLLVTGFPYVHDDLFDRTFDLYRELHHRCQGVRRLGAAALDFCYVGAGRLDAFYEARLHPWDLCAGDLICREAGGQTSDWEGGPIPFSGRRILASNGLIHDQVLDVLNLPSFADIR
ncbi:inositol monophosphatase family protein [Candidatus Neomarinimicrobiota bacterium]